MKKNLRIVSAVAAALLAVAPVAAAAVATPASVVNAATTVASGLETQKASASATDDALKSDAVNYLNSYLAGKNSEFQVATSNNGTATIHFVASQKFEAGTPSKTTTGNKQTAVVPVKGQDNKIVLNVKTSKGFNDGDTFKIFGQTISHSQIQNANADNNATEFQVTLNNVELPVNFDLSAVKPAPAAENVYFARWDGRELANDATVIATNSQNNELFHNKNGNMRSTVTLAELKVAIENVLTLRNSKNEKASWSKNVWNNATSDDNLISQLRHAGFTVKGSGNKATFAPGSTAFTINVKALNGATANVVFQNSYAPDTVSPVIMGNYNGKWEPVRTTGGYIRPIVVSQNDLGNNSAWNPYDYLRADANSTTKAWISADYSGDKVDLTKPGVYNVTVKATNAAGKTTTETVPVIVSDINGKLMTVVNAASVFAINNGVASQASGLKTLPVGSQVKVFGSVATAKLNGQDTQFYRIVSPKANYWVKASDLKDGAATPAANETTANKTIMHIAAVYTKNGVKTTERLRAYDSVSVVATPVTLKDANGKEIAGKFYKLAGQDKYIKVSNVDGTSKTLKHNSYVYTQYGKKVYKKNGKAVKMPKRGKRGSLRKEASGKTLTVYGGALFNKQYYRIGRNQYIKVANFR